MWECIIQNKLANRIQFASVFLISVILFSCYLPLRSSADDEFPVGLTLEYEIEYRSGYSYSNSLVKTYEFTRWTDDAQTTVELQIDSSTVTVLFPGGAVDILSSVPLWTDVSYWTTGSMIFKGRTYEVSRSSRNGYQTWYLHARVDGPGDFESEFWNLHYDVSLGFLVFYGNVDFESLSTSELTASLEDSNLRSFMFLGGFLNTPWIMPLLLLGIALELGIISYELIKRRRTRPLKEQ